MIRRLLLVALACSISAVAPAQCLAYRAEWFLIRMLAGRVAGTRQAHGGDRKRHLSPPAPGKFFLYQPQQLLFIRQSSERVLAGEQLNLPELESVFHRHGNIGSYGGQDSQVVARKCVLLRPIKV